MAVDRETLVEQSVTEFARASLLSRGYPQEKWEIVDWDDSKIVQLDRILIAMGFNFDDGGSQGECGSDLKHRLYTLEFWVFGKTSTQARNVANVLKFAIENGDDGTIPLLDVAQIPPVEVDRLVVTRAEASRQKFQDPEPWQQFTWLTTIQVEDYYQASLA